jgi:hypothetical protein
MRLGTIWTLPASTLAERLHRTRDWAAQVIAGALPHRIRYWTFIDMAAAATMDSPDIPSTPLHAVLDGISTPKNLT